MERWGAMRGRRPYGGKALGRCRSSAAVVVAAGLAMAACGDDGTSNMSSPADEANPTTTDTTDLPRCDDVSNLVFFGLNGVLTLDAEEIFTWVANPGYVMEPAPGAAELTEAYIERGYELVYPTRGSDAMVMDEDVPYPEAVTLWLETQGIPIGDRARLLLDIGELGIVDELVSLSASGATIHAAYTSNEGDIEKYVNGGVPRDRVYTVGDAAGRQGSTEVADGDLTTHLALVEELPPVCRTAATPTPTPNGDDEGDGRDEDSVGD